MKLHLPLSLRRSVMSCLCSVLGCTLAAAMAWAEGQNLTYDGATLTWDTQSPVFKDADGAEASFTAGDNVTFVGQSVVTLEEDIAVGRLNIADGAEVRINYGDYALSAERIGLSGTLDVGAALAVGAGTALAVEAPSAVLTSGLILADEGSLSVAAAANLSGSSLSLQGGTAFSLTASGDGRTYKLFTEVGSLLGADGSALELTEANNAISLYFDTSQPGSGYWKNATLQLTSDGTLQMQLHNGKVKNALTITDRQTGSVNYCYYESISFEDIVYSTSSYASGGAIYGGDITLSDNGSVTFDGNTSTSSDSYASGGAIYGVTITLSDNGSVIFSGNTASGGYGASGGAISANYKLNIRNNDSVLFEKNAIISNGSYRLRSIVAGDSLSVVSLSAAKGKSIEFRDSVYIYSGSTVKFNEDYTDAAGLVHKQEGDIIFTGAYTEKHLNELLTAAEAGRTATAAEIENSRLTFVDAKTQLYGGRLRVEDGAIYQGRGITAMAGSGATVRVQDAELDHSRYDLTFNSGTRLELVGDSSLLCSTLMMEEGSTLLLDASSAVGTCALTGNLTMNGSMQLLLGETTSSMENAVLMWVSGEVSGWTDSSLTLNSSTGDAHITWVNNHLVLNYNASTYNQYFNGSIAYSERQFAPIFYHHYEEISFKDIAYSTSSSSAYGGAIDGGDNSTITLSANRSVTFSGNTSTSTTSSAKGGAIYGYGDITLSDNDGVTFSGNKATSTTSSAEGGAIYGGSYSTITLSNNGSVTFSGNSASGGYYASGGAIYGGNYSTITLSANDGVTFSGNTASDVGYASGGAIYGYGDITLSDNGSVTFSGNTATSSVSFASGGAIRAYGNLSILNNDSVLFEKNAEISNGSYRLRSIYAGGSGDVISLSAAKGKSIEFRDSVYIASGSMVKLNEDYTDAAGLVHKQEGDIIFTGAYTEKHLNELLRAAEAGRTAKDSEIANSRRSEMHGEVTLYGGRLRVEEKAVLKTSAGLTVAEGSNATVKVSNAELDAGESDITIGASGTLELSNGAVVRANEIIIDEDATLALSSKEMQARTTFALREAVPAVLSSYHTDNAVVIDGNLTLNGGSTLLADNAHFSMTEGSVLTFNASDDKKINLVLTLGTVYEPDVPIALFSDVDSIRFIYNGTELTDGNGVNLNNFFTGAWINEQTSFTYDAEAGTVFVKNVNSLSVPEPTTATLSMLALAALAARRRRSKQN